MTPRADQPGPNRYLTSEEVAALFGVKATTVTWWARCGKLEAIRTPGRWRFPEAAVLALYEARARRKGGAQ